MLELSRLIDDQALAEKLETTYGRGAASSPRYRNGNRSSAREDPPTKALVERRAVLAPGARRSRPRRDGLAPIGHAIRAFGATPLGEF